MPRLCVGDPADFYARALAIGRPTAIAGTIEGGAKPDRAASAKVCAGTDLTGPFPGAAQHRGAAATGCAASDTFTGAGTGSGSSNSAAGAQATARHRS